jgi:hypothetical protein
VKIRSGLVSNSSSSSFVVSLSDFNEEDRAKIARLTERSDDLTRCTGKITDINGWLELYSGDSDDPEDKFWGEKTLKALMAGVNDLIIIRESDEGMGGYFDEDYGLSSQEIEKKALYSFEYH